MDKTGVLKPKYEAKPGTGLAGESREDASRDSTGQSLYSLDSQFQDSCEY